MLNYVQPHSASTFVTPYSTKMTIIGTVTYISLSGGFWGIVSDDGQQYLPVNNSLPADFQAEGIRLTAKATPSSAATIYMWGLPVKLTNLQRT